MFTLVSNPPQESALSEPLLPGLQSLRNELDRAARLDEPVLLTGEPGSGRSGVARLLHAAWSRRHGVQARLCVWSESAGAPPSRAGHGTLYVPDVDTLSPHAQQQLLQWLRGGDDEDGSAAPARWRLLASAGRDLVALTLEGRFDAGLLHRVDVLRVAVPPLRARPGDAWQSALDCLAAFSRATGLPRHFGAPARRAIEHCSWPGNLPQLKACVLRAATASDHECIQRLPCTRQNCLARAALPQGRPSRLVDRATLIDALERSGWVQAQAARRLQLTIRQVNYAVSRYGIDVQRP